MRISTVLDEVNPRAAAIALQARQELESRPSPTCVITFQEVIAALEDNMACCIRAYNPEKKLHAATHRA